MKKVYSTLVTLMSVLIMMSPSIVHAMSKHNAAGVTNLNQHQICNKSSLLVYRQVKNNYNDDLIDFEGLSTV